MQSNGGPDFPHQFQCDDCDGCVDIHPPSQDWEPRSCGGFYRGARCGQPLYANQIVCLDCAPRVAVQQLVFSTSGRKFLLEQLGAEEVRDRAIEMQREKEAELDAKRAAREAARKDDAGHVVYYARLGANHIKIGTSGDLPRRMVELRVVNASNLLAAEPGGYDLETQRHDQFRKWRYSKRKEDFGEGPDLLAHIAEVRATHGAPYEVAAATTAKASAQESA